MDARAVLRSLNLADPERRPDLTRANAAVEQLAGAANFAIAALSGPGAPTRTEREEIIARLSAALANFGGAA